MKLPSMRIRLLSGGGGSKKTDAKPGPEDGKKKRQEPKGKKEKPQEPQLPTDSFYVQSFAADVKGDSEPLDDYKVGEARVIITQDMQYLVSEPQFSSEESRGAYDRIMNYKKILRSDIIDRPPGSRMDSEDLKGKLMDNILAGADELGLRNLINPDYGIAKYYAARDILGHEILDVPMRDTDHLEDVTCSDYTSVGVMHRKYLEHGVLRTNLGFRNMGHMGAFLDRLARHGGKHLSTSDPILDFNIGEKYRISIISGEVTANSSHALSVRIKSSRPFTLTDMIKGGTVPASVVAVIWKMLENSGTGMVVGGTGAGKTSLLNTLFPLIHHSAKIISIEDAAELQIPQRDWVPLLIDVPIASEKYHDRFRQFLNASLRQRPQMIAVGEVRGISTKLLFDVASTGHAVLSSFHSYSCQGAMSKITSEYGVHPASFSHIWFMLNPAVVRDADGMQVRRCISFDEVVWDSEKGASLNTLCEYDAKSGRYVGDSAEEMASESVRLKELGARDASSDMEADLAKRIGFINSAVEKNADTPYAVMEVLRRYHAS